MLKKNKTRKCSRKTVLTMIIYNQMSPVQEKGGWFVREDLYCLLTISYA